MFFRKKKRAFIFQISVILIAGFLIATFFAPPAAAQALCTMRSDILEKLAEGYSENPTAMGLANDGRILEVFTSPKGGSWTIVITTPDGVSCLMASGENWDSAYKIIVGKES